MVLPQPYCGMPMFAPHHMRHPPPSCHSTQCPGADASTPNASSSGATPNLGCGDADRICHLSLQDEEEEKSEDGANDDSFGPPGERWVGFVGVFFSAMNTTNMFAQTRNYSQKYLFLTPSSLSCAWIDYVLADFPQFCNFLKSRSAWNCSVDFFLIQWHASWIK